MHDFKVFGPPGTEQCLQRTVHPFIHPEYIRLAAATAILLCLLFAEDNLAIVQEFKTRCGKQLISYLYRRLFILPIPLIIVFVLAIVFLKLLQIDSEVLCVLTRALIVLLHQLKLVLAWFHMSHMLHK